MMSKEGSERGGLVKGVYCSYMKVRDPNLRSLGRTEERGGGVMGGI